MGQVATATNWFEQNNKITCRPRKVGLPVLDREVCLGTASSPHTISIDKGCIGVIGASSTLCTVIPNYITHKIYIVKKYLILGRCR